MDQLISWVRVVAIVGVFAGVLIAFNVPRMVVEYVLDSWKDRAWVGLILVSASLGTLLTLPGMERLQGRRERRETERQAPTVWQGIVDPRQSSTTSATASEDLASLSPDALIIHNFLLGKSVDNESGAWLIQTSEEEWAPRVQKGLDEITNKVGIEIDISSLRAEIEGPRVQISDQYFRLVG
jgi:hypothetical protein